jgi:hypothetical protein
LKIYTNSSPNIRDSRNSNYGPTERCVINFNKNILKILKQAKVCNAFVAEMKTPSEISWFLDDPCFSVDEAMAGRHHPLKMLCFVTLLSICVKLPCNIETVETTNDLTCYGG